MAAACSAKASNAGNPVTVMSRIGLAQDGTAQRESRAEGKAYDSLLVWYLRIVQEISPDVRQGRGRHVAAREQYSSARGDLRFAEREGVANLVENARAARVNRINRDVLLGLAP